MSVCPASIKSPVITIISGSCSDSNSINSVLLFHEGRTYGQPEVVPISLPQVATGLRSRLPGSFRRRGFQPDLLMPQEALFARGAHSMQAAMRRALLRRGRSGNTAFSKTESNVAGNLCRMCRKGESRHGDFSLHNQNSRTK